MSDADVDLLVIAGAGGFGREVAWLARNAMPEVDVVLAVTDPKWLDAMASTEVRLLSDLPHDAHFVCAIGDPRGRRSTVEACVNHGLTPTSLIHSSIDLLGENTVGVGAVMCAGVIVTTGINIGTQVHLNLATTVGHDVVIDDYVTTAPGVNISGHVHIESDVYIGTGATIINGSVGRPLVIGRGAVVGAGACVIRDVPPGVTVAGVPAKALPTA